MSAEETKETPAEAGTSDDQAETLSDTELDALLDSALEDFNAPPAQPRASGSKLGKGKEREGEQDGAASEWTEEFIKQATVQFEHNMRLLLKKAEEKGAAAPPNPEELEGSLKKHAEEAAKCAANGMSSESLSVLLAENLKTLTENTSNLQSPLSEDEMTRMLGSMSVGEEDSASDGELGELMPFMQTMMQSLLSKDLLYPAIQDVVAKYPGWLSENKSKIEEEQYGKYEKQFDMMKQVCREFESEKESDPEDIKRTRFERILGMMNKMQEYGQPPKEIVGDIGPLSMPTDFSMPSIPGLPSDQCVVM